MPIADSQSIAAHASVAQVPRLATFAKVADLPTVAPPNADIVPGALRFYEPLQSGLITLLF